MPVDSPHVLLAAAHHSPPLLVVLSPRVLPAAAVAVAVAVAAAVAVADHSRPGRRGLMAAPLLGSRLVGWLIHLPSGK